MWVARVAFVVLSAGCAAQSEPIVGPFQCPESDAVEDGGTVSDLCRVIEPIRHEHNLPALAAVVWAGDQIVAEGAVGIRKVGTSVAVSKTDKWHLGSATKPMTATLAALLAAEGALSLDETLASLFPGQAMHPMYEAVTLRLLLSHRSGTRRDLTGAPWQFLRDDPRSFEPRQILVELVLKQGPALAVGEFSYSNVGYIIAGAALERRTGTSWERLVTNRLFARLGMSSCGFGSPADVNSTDQPWGHQVSHDEFVSRAGPAADNPPSAGPAMTVHCSLADWGKFLSEHRRAARGDQTVFPGQALRELHAAPAASIYAIGWFTWSPAWLGEPLLSHSGSNRWFFADGWIVPTRDFMVAVATNVAGERGMAATGDLLGILTQQYSR